MISRRVPIVVVLLGAVVGTAVALTVVPSMAKGPHDRVDLLQPGLDPQRVQADEHIQWFVRWLNGEHVPTVDEIRQRFSPLMLDAVDPDAVSRQTDDLRRQAPFRYRGTLQSLSGDPPYKVVLLTDREDRSLELTVAPAPANPRVLDGSLIVYVPSKVSINNAVLVILALTGLALVALGAALGWDGRRRGAWLLIAAGWLELAQLLVKAPRPLWFTVGLLSAPFAVAVAVHGALAITTYTRRPSLDRPALLAAYLSAAAAGALWCLVDTRLAGLPRNLALISHNPPAGRAIAFGVTASALVAAALLVATIVRRVTRAEPVSLSALVPSLGVASVATIVAVWSVLRLSQRRSLRQTGALPTPIIVATLVCAGFVLVYALMLSTERRHALADAQASRARLVEASDAARRQVERDLHDGTQQRLLAMLVNMRRARDQYGRLDHELDRELQRAGDDLQATLDEVRSVARGLHPPALDHGLVAAIRSIAERAALPTEVTINDQRRTPLPLPLATTAWFVVSESVTNAAKHSKADFVRVRVDITASQLTVRVSDDGIGGADAARGTGLRRLEDRISAIGGSMRVGATNGSQVPPSGTTITARLPITGVPAGPSP